MNVSAEIPVHRALRWYQTISFRVTVLCGVLLVCLLASVLVLTRYYINEAAAEMKEQAARTDRAWMHGQGVARRMFAADAPCASFAAA